MTHAYYNEIDPKAAAWLRELIKVGAIAPGDVDERSIVDVRPADLRGYRQCHFFAGIGIWSYALRQAGWPDERKVWTGSCPCQPFSAAGKRKAQADERHLWPTWFGLISECRPLVVFGEQVSDGDGYAWLDDVGHDLEGIAYTLGAVCPAACCVGAPHERQRLYFVADAQDAERRPGERGEEAGARPHGEWRRGSASGCVAGGMADSTIIGRRQERADGRRHDARDRAQGVAAGLVSSGDARRLADTDGRRESDGRIQRGGQHGLLAQDGSAADGDRRPGPLNGFWRTADWLRCQDERWRPVESGTFPLADGDTARLGRLRGYGNGLVAPLATEFIRAYIDVRQAA